MIYWWAVGLSHFLVVMFVRCSILLAGDQDSLVEHKRF